ncbi:MAG: HAMP domain-containing histidine kinase [Chloroflexi bacterium]|nr:HAMP domain-containing histidine kinase [Chloroflexota bacterium]
MKVFELRYVVFFIAVLMLFAALLGAQWVRWRMRRMEKAREHWLWRQAPIGVLVLDAQGQIIDANARARAWLELEEEASISALDQGWSETLLDDVREALTTAQVRQRTVVLPRERALSWQIAPREAAAWVFLQDVSAAVQQKRLVEFLMKDLSHELRTPLSIILTNLRLLQRGNLENALAQEALNVAEAEARHLRLLMNDMFDLGRLEAREHLPMRPLDFAHLLNEVVKDMASAFEERKVAITVTMDDELPLVMGNDIWLRRALSNLLDNVLKFCRSGDEADVRLEAVSSGVRFRLCDTGPGIPDDHLPFVTHRFRVTEHGEKAGSGLGLALVAEILRHHHSELRLESPPHELDHGLCVEFILPAAPVEKP